MGMECSVCQFCPLELRGVLTGNGMPMTSSRSASQL